MHLSCFDLDHTLIKVNSSFLFGRYLSRKKVFPKWHLVRLAFWYSLHKLGVLSIETLQRTAFTKLFCGVCAEKIESLADSFFTEYFDKILCEPAIQALNVAKSQGDYIAILSSSPEFLVSRFAKRLGVNDWRGSLYAKNKNMQFVAIEKIILSHDKAAYINDKQIELGIEKSQTTAYSDSIHDRSFLEAAGNAIAVNPDRPLGKLCKNQNWKIIRSS